MGYMDGVTDLGTVFGSGSAGAVGGFNPVAGLAGGALEFASNWYGNRKAQARQREAFDQQKWMMQNRYQMQVGDLKAAGLNPMLATTQGAPMPGSVGQASVKTPDMVNAMANATVSSASAYKMRQEALNLQIENNNLRNISVIQLKTMGKINAEIDEIDSKIEQNKASKEEINRRADLLRAQALLVMQEFRTKEPEEIASATEGAVTSAKIKRIYSPLFDILQSLGGFAYKGATR